MQTCDRWQELMLDFVYGLLDEQEAGELQQHLAGCPACQAELAKAGTSKDRLSRAALAIRDVAPFEIPAETIPSTLFPSMVPAAAPTAEPPKPAKRGMAWTLTWSVVGALAASIAGFGIFVFRDQQTQVAQRQAEVAHARKQIEAVDVEFAKLKDRLQREMAESAKKASMQFQRVELTGSSPYSPTDGQEVRVSVQDAKGEKDAARIEVQAVDRDTKEVLSKQTVLALGDAKVKIPPHLPSKKLDIVVEAQNLKSGAKTRLFESLAVSSSGHVAHLAINKTAYMPNEVLFFRVLVLQRFSLKPPEKPVSLRVGLFDAKGNRVLDRAIVTAEGGIAAGELSLLPSLPSGAYVLEATGNGAESDVVSVRRPLELVRGNDDLRFALNNRALRAGSNSLNLELSKNGQPLGKQDIRVRVQAYGQQNTVQNNQPSKEAEQLLTEGRGQTNASGLAQVPVELPKNFDADKALIEIEVELKDGKERRKMTQEVRVISSKLEVDLFPEGGDLIAGIPNRVYWRVRTPQGETVSPEGHVIVLDSKSVIYDSERAQALGRFEFVPDANEKYVVRITSSQHTTEQKDPFASLPIRAEGVQLRVEDSVTAVGEPVAIDLNVHGGDKNLLVAAVCRGRPVEQIRLAANSGNNKAKLQLATAGVHRITVFELNANGQKPVAERLVYRVPNRMLTVKAETGTGQAAPGQKASLHLNVLDEAKHAARGWSLASVVDERFLADGPDATLATHFLLLNEVRRGEDLEDAVMLPVGDADASRQAMDLFLGTAGWRHFVNVQEHRGEEAKLAKAAAPTFFRQASESASKLTQRYEALVAQEGRKLEVAANRERAALETQRQEAARVLAQASDALAAEQARPAETLRLIQGAAALVCLAIGILGIAFGVIARLRNRSAGVSYGIAFAGMGACMALFALRPDDVAGPHPTDTRFAAAGYPPLVAAPPAERQRRGAAAPDSENFEVAIASDAAKDGRKEKGAAANLAKTEAMDRMAARRDGLALRNNLNNSYADMNLQTQSKAADEMQRRYAENVKHQSALPKAAMTGNKGTTTTEPAGKDLSAKGKQDPSTTVLDPKDMKKAEQKADKDGFGSPSGLAREYSFRRQSGIEYQDTLLWYPNLPIADGAAHATFDLPNTPATYRVLIHAHDADGRFGTYEGRLEIKSGRK